MQSKPRLHTSIVALLSLAAGIAAKHPDRGRRHVARLRELGVPEHQISQAIEIARAIRQAADEEYDEAVDALLAAKDEKEKQPGGETP
jgi:hypothetical protein